MHKGKGRYSEEMRMQAIERGKSRAGILRKGNHLDPDGGNIAGVRNSGGKTINPSWRTSSVPSTGAIQQKVGVLM
jgi:hypothetical protein